MTASLVRADALRIPLADESVDLIVTSPPYFALRSYQDDGGHYAGQIGSEATPREFLEALWSVTAEMVRVLKPTGSLFVNLGDKYAGSGGHNNSGIAGGASQLQGASQRRVPVTKATRRSAPDRYNQNSDGIPAKSLMGLPWRYAIGCIDQLGLILRAEIVWSKPNGLPESVQDRVRRSHEQWFHLTRQGRYYSAVDEIREPHGEAHGGGVRTEYQSSEDGRHHKSMNNNPSTYNPLGKLPGSVWTVPTEPLSVPEHLGDHFAAFPQEWPRRLILGWSPSGICVECGEGRRPAVDTAHVADNQGRSGRHGGPRADAALAGPPRQMMNGQTVATITGYACACPAPSAPTRPAVVLDPFAGTGTTVMVARALGRYGVGVDLSADYLRLARWRVFESGHAAKTVARTNRERQGSLL